MSQVIIPKGGEFRHDLDKGASQLSTYDKKFEIYTDFRDFKRENVRIKITPNGIINLCILSDSKDGSVYYDEDFIIPEHERAIRNNFICQMNDSGILRISGLFSPVSDTNADSLITFSKTAVREPESETGNKIGMKEEQEQETITKLRKLVSKSETTVIQEEDQNQDQTVTKPKVGRKTRQKAEVSSEQKKAEEPKDVVFKVKPLDSDFECDISLIQDKPDFRVTAGMTWRTFVNTSRLSPEDIKIEIINNRIVRISKKFDEVGLYSRPFLKEVPIPLGCCAEDIEVTFNDRGILRLIAETEESRLLALGKGVIVQKASSPTPTPIILAQQTSAPILVNVPNLNKLTLIKPKITETPAVASSATAASAAMKTKTNVSTPWGKRVATATTELVNQTATPNPTKIYSNEKFEASIIAKDYSPDELEISIDDGWLTVTGKKKVSPFGENSFRNKTFTKKIQIPENINPEAVVCGQDATTGIIHVSTEAPPK